MLTETASDFIDTAGFAESVTYKHYNSATGLYDADASIDAIVVDNFPNQEDHPETGMGFAVAELSVAAADVTPHHMDRFTFHDYTWDVAPGGWHRSNIFYKVELVRGL